MTDTKRYPAVPPPGTHENSLRRWTDKALIGAIGLVCSMIAFMWITLANQVQAGQTTNAAQDVKLERVNISVEAMRDEIRRVDTRQERMDGKLDEILKKVR